MPKLYMVSYDLTRPVRDYERLWAALARLGAKSVLKSQWVLRNQASAYDLASHFAKFIDSDDKLIVNELTSNCAWVNTGDITKAA